MFDGNALVSTVASKYELEGEEDGGRSTLGSRREEIEFCRFDGFTTKD
jgi:hypothetical protein